MKSDTFINSFCGAQPPHSHFDMLSPWRRQQQRVCVCECVFRSANVCSMCVYAYLKRVGRGLSRDKRERFW